MRPINILSMILAGGIGERLYPLTSNRCKPTVPFGGNFRIIDFTLMNCVCSGLRRIHVLTQYHAQSLNRHRVERWNFLASELGEYIEMVPPKMRGATGYYHGTAHAIYRNLEMLDQKLLSADSRAGTVHSLSFWSMVWNATFPCSILTR